MTDIRESIELHWGERHATAQLRRTRRRVLRIEIKPSGEVVVFAPEGEEVQDIEPRVRRKCPWIFRELDRIESAPVVTPPRHFLSGETHLLLGKPYRLAIEEGMEEGVRTDGDRLVMFTPRVDDSMDCSRLLDQFYMSTAKSVFPERLDAMAPPFIRRGMAKPALVIRAMSKRWGSFTASGRILLNVDLARASPVLIDYVICHELAHAFFPDHGKAWRDLLSTVMPDWEARKERLESSLS